jgi:hypothetical protein
METPGQDLQSQSGGNPYVPMPDVTAQVSHLHFIHQGRRYIGQKKRSGISATASVLVTTDVGPPAWQWDRLSYYSAVSWTDSQIGRVLTQLDALKGAAVIMMPE